MNSLLDTHASAQEMRAEIDRLRRLLADAGVEAAEIEDAHSRALSDSEDRASDARHELDRLQAEAINAQGTHDRDLAASGARTASARDQVAALQADATQAATVKRVAAQSEALRRAIMESVTEVAIISLDASGLVTSWNEGATRIMGWAEAEMIGRPANVFFTDEEVAAGVPQQEMRQAREVGRGEDERFHKRKDGNLFWASGLLMPLFDDEDEEIGFVKILRDHTREHVAQETLKRSEAELRLQRNLLEAIFEAAPVGLSLAAAPSGASILLNAEMQRIIGGVDLRGPDVQRYERARAFHPDGQPYTVDDYPSVRALRDGESVRNQLLSFMHSDGGSLRAEISSSPIRGPEGDIVASITTVVDVEGREQAIAHQQLLMGELAHRMKNTLSIVQAIVSQTLRSSSSLANARGEIMERLAVLSRAQDALTRKNWMSASLADTVGAALAPLGLASERLVVEGPEVMVGSRAALSFTLALHELATNAVKYGSLSASLGRVEIRWSQEAGERLAFTWNEKGGPVVQPPSRKGFGSRLIETVSRTFSGESTLTYDPAGVCWQVTAGLDALQAF